MYHRYFALQNKTFEESLENTRDFYLLLLLNEFFTSKYRLDLILKGVSAANLAYGIGRGDFSLQLVTLKEIPVNELFLNIKKFVSKVQGLSIISDFEERYTYNLDLRVRENEEIDFKIDLEITKIKYGWKKGVNYDVKALKCKNWNYSVLANVQNLGEIIAENSGDPQFMNIRI